MLEIYNESYKSMESYYLDGNIYLDVKLSFEPNVIKDMERNNYKGIYKYRICRTEYDVKTYEFVFTSLSSDSLGEGVLLQPIALPDLEFFDFLQPTENFLKGDIYEADYYAYYWSYTPYQKSIYQTDESELVSLDGIVRKINENDTYVMDNGINYQILDERDFEIPKRPISGLKKAGLYEKMKDDSFMGKYVMVCAYNTGEITQEEYIISHIEDEDIVLNPVSPRNMLNTPFVLKSDDSDNPSSYMSVRSLISENYIEYSDAEDISVSV